MTASPEPNPTLPAARLVGRIALLASCVTLGAACAGAQQEVRPTPLSEPAPQQALPDLPRDPLQLITGDATEVVHVNLETLRESPQYSLLRSWAERFACLAHDDSHWFLDRSRRAVAASFPAQGAGRNLGLFVLLGNYDGDTPRAALAEGASLLGASGANEAPGEVTRGRFTLIVRGGLAGVLLSPELMALGDRAAVEAMLDLADGKRSDRFVEGALYGTLGGDDWIQANGAAGFAQPSEGYRSRLERQLATVGARKLLQNLQKNALAAGLALEDGVKLDVIAHYHDEASAAEAAATAKQLYFQGNLLLRLTGMPRIFEHATADAENDEARFGLALSDAEIAGLRGRVEWLLNAAAEDNCPADKASRAEN